MLSAPYDYSSSNFLKLLNLDSGKIATWEPLLSTYVLNPSYPADTMRLGAAYWARLATSEVLQAQGTPAPSGLPYNIPLVPTWNQISDPFPVPIALSACSVTVTGGQTVSFAQASQPSYNFIDGTIFSYDTASGQYVAHYIGNQSEPNPMLQPYIGYWFAANTSCNLVVPAPAGY